MSEGQDYCAFCVWAHCYNGGGERQTRYRADFIECRRHAPLAYAKESGERRGAWPPVSNLDWCGDFTRTTETRW